jgi:nucleoside-diphosphate-sugar epimerase
MSSSAKQPTVAIIGSTGGSGLATLRQCLAASYSVTVLVRQPSKLLSLLSVPSAPPNLTVVTGSVRDAAAVKSTLRNPDGSLVDIVISCIGFVPGASSKLLSLDLFNGFDKRICLDGTRIIVECIAELRAETASASDGKGPVLVVLSSTGVTAAARDVPLAMVPLYRITLGPPHKDKKDMEDYLHSLSASSPPANTAQKWVIIRPSLLFGDGKGEPSGKKIRVGIEKDGKAESSAVGYRISREDVGYWLFEHIVRGEGEDGGEKTADEWVGKCVTLTY